MITVYVSKCPVCGEPFVNGEEVVMASRIFKVTSKPVNIVKPQVVHRLYRVVLEKCLEV